MDPTIIPQVGSVAILLGGIAWLSRQYVIMGRKLDASAADCIKRERLLVERVQSLEDGRNADLRQIVDAAMESMRLTASALRENSGSFRAMTESSGMHRAAVTREPR